MDINNTLKYIKKNYRCRIVPSGLVSDLFEHTWYISSQ